MVKKNRYIPNKDVIKLWVRADGKCAICKTSLGVEFDKSGYQNTGNIAHIVPYSANNARSLKDEKHNNAYENLILLCSSHHNIIDKASKDFSTEQLLKIKKEHEGSVFKNKKSEISDNESVINLNLISGFSKHSSLSTIIPKKIRNILRTNYGYFSVDLFINNLGNRNYNKIKIEILPQNTKFPEKISFSKYPITRQNTPYCESVEHIVNQINNGEENIVENLFYLNYWDFESIDHARHVIKEIEFEYYLTADYTNPKKGRLKLTTFNLIAFDKESTDKQDIIF